MSKHYFGTTMPSMTFPYHVEHKIIQDEELKALHIPDQEACFDLWAKYKMPKHIQLHSQGVADIASTIAAIAIEQGAPLILQEVKAAALLHDLGKLYCIENGGSHAQLGASWVVRETRNFRIGQAVLHHVYWPFEPNVYENSWLMGLIIVYSDKRVRHAEKVTLSERFDDLIARYGDTPEKVVNIKESKNQGLKIEAALSQRFGVKLHEYSFNSGRLV